MERYYEVVEDGVAGAWVRNEKNRAGDFEERNYKRIILYLVSILLIILFGFN